MGAKTRRRDSRPLQKIAGRLTAILSPEDEAERRGRPIRSRASAETCQAAAHRVQVCEEQRRTAEPRIVKANKKSECEGQETCNRTPTRQELRHGFEILYNEVRNQGSFPPLNDCINDGAGVQDLPLPHIERSLIFNDCSRAHVADENNQVLTERGGQNPELSWIGKLVRLGTGCNRCGKRIITRITKTVNTIKDPTGAVVAMIMEFSARVLRARRQEERAALAKNSPPVQHIMGHVTERGGAGSNHFSQHWKRDGRLRSRLRHHRQALGNRFGRVQRWLIGNRGSDSMRPMDSIPPNVRNTTAATAAATPRSAGSVSTGPFPPYEDPSDGPERSSSRCSYISHKYSPGQRVSARDVGLDTDIAPDQPAPSRMASNSPGIGRSHPNTEIRDVRFAHIDWNQRPLDNIKAVSRSSESINISSLDSQDLRSLRRLWSRDHWELQPMDFRPRHGDPSRSRTFDSSWLASFRGRTWMEAQKSKLIYEAELVGDSTDALARSSTGSSAEAGLDAYKIKSGETCSPSSHHFLNHTMPRLQKLAFRVARPVSDAQGARTLSYNSWFDNVQNRRIGTWQTPKSDLLEGNDDAPRSQRSRSQSASPHPPSDDIYDATPPRQGSPERVVTPRQMDQPASSSLPVEVDDFDSQVLKSIHDIFRPSVEQIFNPLRTMGYNLPEPLWDLPRRPSTVDSSGAHSPSTAASSRFPSIGTEITPATTAGEGSRTEGDPEVEGSESKGTPLAEDDGQIEDVDLD